MAKITELPLADDITALDLVMMVQDGVAVRGNLKPLFAITDQISIGKTPVAFTESNTNDEHRIFQFFNFVIGKSYRFWALVKTKGRHQLNLYAGGALPMSGTFNIDAGSASGMGAKIVSRGDGEFLIQVTKVAIATGGDNFQLRLLSDGGEAPYPGDGASGVYVVAAGVDEDGIALGANDTTTLLSATWTKQGLLPPALAPAGQFLGIAQKVYNLTGASTAQPLAGKTWAALGTSQTIGGAYTGPLASLAGMTLTNLGVSGTTFSNGGVNASAGIYNQIASIPLDTEVTSVEGLINDHYFHVPLGTLADTTLATFYGALYYVWKAIAARVPNARIIFIQGTPGCGTGTNAAGRNSRSANGVGLYPRDYQDAMRKFCENESVLLSAVGQRAGINDTNGDRLLADGLHYGSLGGQVVADFVNDDLNTMAHRGMLV